MYLFQKHPKNNNIEFIDEDKDGKRHIYKVNGKIVNLSVTKLRDELFPFDQKKIAKQISEHTGKDPEKIVEDWNVLKKKSGSEGTAMHEIFEKFIKNVKLPKEHIFENELNGFKQYNNYEILNGNIPLTNRAEWRIYDENLGICGTIDCVRYNFSKKTYILEDYKRINHELIAHNDIHGDFEDLICSNEFVCDEKVCYFNVFDDLQWDCIDKKLSSKEKTSRIDWIKYALQLDLYRTILESYKFIDTCIEMRILIFYKNYRSVIKIKPGIFKRRIDRIFQLKNDKLNIEKNV